MRSCEFSVCAPAASLATESVMVPTALQGTAWPLSSFFAPVAHQKADWPLALPTQPPRTEVLCTGTGQACLRHGQYSRSAAPVAAPGVRGPELGLAHPGRGECGLLPAVGPVPLVAEDLQAEDKGGAQAHRQFLQEGLRSVAFTSEHARTQVDLWQGRGTYVVDGRQPESASKDSMEWHGGRTGERAAPDGCLHLMAAAASCSTMQQHPRAGPPTSQQQGYTAASHQVEQDLTLAAVTLDTWPQAGQPTACDLSRQGPPLTTSAQCGACFKGLLCLSALPCSISRTSSRMAICAQAWV